MMSPVTTATLDRHFCFERALTAARTARLLLAQDLARAGWGDADVDRAQLVTSELVANAVVHAGTPVGFRYVLAEVLRIEVTDNDPTGDPVPRPLDVRRPGGMGLALVAGASRAWGVMRTATAKTVWCEIEPGSTPTDR